jgi:hypothetical protein
MARLLRSVVCVALGVGACNNSAAPIAGVTPSTAISVDPAEFLGNVKCGIAPGEMQVYVATLKDASPHSVLRIGDRELVLPSSAPVGCGIPVLFENILNGRQYEAAVDGYDRSDIRPLAPGSRIMVSTRDGGGEYVAPRWTTTCGHYRLPPEFRSDGGVIHDAGRLEVADSGFQSDGGYYDCSPVVLGPGKVPWLGGPACASTRQTVTVGGCVLLQ